MSQVAHVVRAPRDDILVNRKGLLARLSANADVERRCEIISMRVSAMLTMLKYHRVNKPVALGGWRTFRHAVLFVVVWR
jgi:hypothetical protein